MFRAAERIRLAVLILASCAITAAAAGQGIFVPTGPMITARSDYAAVLLADGKVLITGGLIDNGVNYSATATAELYDPATGTFVPTTGTMTFPRSGHTATALADGKVLIAGGGIGIGITDSAELYDPSTQTFSPTNAMTTARWYHTATLLPGGKVLLVGGWGNATAELYDPVSGTFTATASMENTRWGHAAVLLPDGKVLVAGGSSRGTEFSFALSSAEVYDPAIGLFTRTKSMVQARSDPCAALLSNGKVLIAGGVDPDYDVYASAELYDIATWSFAATGSMAAPRTCSPATATRLADGKVLLAGNDANSMTGYTGSRTAELYDPATGTFSFTGLMSAAHSYFSPILLANGEVLIAGGDLGSNNSAAAELFRVESSAPSTADLQLVASAAPAAPDSGDRFDFVVLLSNLGPDPAKNVVITLSVPFGVASLDYVNITPTCPMRWDESATVLSCVLDHDLAPGATEELKFAASAWGVGDSTVSAATSSTDPQLGNNLVTVDLAVSHAKLSVYVAGSGTVTSSPSGIDCGTTCQATFDSSATVNLTATPAAGWTFKNWYDGCSGSGPCTVTMDVPRYVTAVFTTQYVLSVSFAGSGSGTVTSNPTGVTCGATCSAPFWQGTIVTLSATPAAGSYFAGWSGGCYDNNANDCVVSIYAATSITATFNTIPKYLLTVTRTGSGAGVVSSNPGGVACGTVCTAEFLERTEVALTATPDAGSVFTGWSGACTGTGSCTVTMAAAANVTATFVVPGFQFASTPPPTTAVHTGSSAQFTLSLSTEGGFSGTVTFACTAGLPSKAACTFNPASVTVGSNGPATTVLTVATTGTTAAGLRTLHELVFALAFLPMTLALAPRRRKVRDVLCVCVLLLLMGLLACGGSAGTKTSTQAVVSTGTPAGTYTVTVTATSGSMSRTQNVVLVVN